jgi:hypothetical protein
MGPGKTVIAEVAEASIARRRNAVTARQISHAEAAASFACTLRVIPLPKQIDGVWHVESRLPNSELPTLKIKRFARGDEVARRRSDRAEGLIARLELDGTISLALFEESETRIFTGIDRSSVILRGSNDVLVDLSTK